MLRIETRFFTLGKLVLAALLVLAHVQNVPALCGSESTKPNVLFVAIDDLNDWIAPLGGHPQVLTPNMDRFCEEGSMIFPNAVCPAPVCGPSRSAILSGFMPNRTGIYGNDHNMRYSELVKSHATLPEYFSKHGYHTLANGKIFHKHASEHGVDFGQWAFDTFARSRRYVSDSPLKGKVTSASSGYINGEQRPEYKSTSKLRWGPTISPFEETVDYRVADWARDQLSRKWDQPFFLSVGFIKPHLSWYVPQPFFDKYDLDSIQVPEVKEKDLVDILNPDGTLAFEPSADYKWITKHHLEREATRAYLASITYADACLGLVLDALENSVYADNTIVVIWGDHGYHLGEKLRYQKNYLWIESVKTPFLVRLPEMQGAVYCDRTVNLLDMYPTLIALCGLPDKELDGHNISPLLSNPGTEWNIPGVTISSKGTSVLTERWHYIEYLSGAKELYDTREDPMEWYNLIRNPQYRDVASELGKWVPKERIPASKLVLKKPPDYVNADLDETIKPRRDLGVLK